MLVRYSGQIDKETYRRVVRLHSRNTRWLTIAFIAVILGSQLFGDTWQSVVLDPLGLTIMAVFIVLFVGLVALALRLWARVFVAWFYHRNVAIFEPFQSSVSDEGFKVTTETEKLVLPWSRLRRALLTPSLALVYRAGNFFLVLDRRFFASDKDWTGAIELVRAHLPTRTRRN